MKTIIMFLLLCTLIVGCNQQEPKFLTGDETLEITILAPNSSPLGHIEVDLWKSITMKGPPDAGYSSTNEKGVAVFKVPEGEYQVGFNMINFPQDMMYPEKQPVTVNKGIINRKTITLVAKNLEESVKESSETIESPATDSTSEPSDPILLNCINNDGEIESRQMPKGMTDFCVFDDKSECEVNDFYNGYCKKGETEIEKETWTKDPKTIIKDKTSTCSILLKDGTLRMYIMKDGISYIESKDGKSFSAPVKTSINGKVFDPAVVYTQGKFILFYDVISGNEKDETASGQDQLWRAESSDGKTFSTPVKVQDRTSGDKYEVTGVPDVLALPDGRLRIYGTQMHDGINTAVSDDLGKTWKTDGKNLIDPGACDPDVHIENGQYVMYYTITEIPKEYENLPKEEIRKARVETDKIMKATSTDGITWELCKECVIVESTSETKGNRVIDPDYVKLKDGTEIIYFGWMSLDETRIELYRTVKEK
jgi:predicted GH43/DUF377 family glycosyl hydrolase